MFEIGQNLGSVHRFAGLVDEVSVYDRALTEAEVQSIFLGLADDLSCSDADGDGVRVCDGDCDDTRPYCTMSCIDADSDGYCQGIDCNETYAGCTIECTDADGDGVPACGGDCDESNPYCTTDCTDADSDDICVTHDCDDSRPNAASSVFAQTVLVSDASTLVWSSPADIRWFKGDLTGLSSYVMSAEGSLFGATSLDISADNPASGTGLYYLVRGQGPCDGWQTSLGAEPERDQRIECGDGVVWSGVESCDDGGESAHCDIDCTLPGCGDGTWNPAAGEECDTENPDCCPDCTLQRLCCPGVSVCSVFPVCC
jgi:hypothetical protein